MKALVIEKDAIRRNAAAVKARAGSAAIYAVLTGDGYGAGLVELAGSCGRRASAASPSPSPPTPPPCGRPASWMRSS